MIVRVAGRSDVPALHALVESAYRGDSARRGWTHEADLLDGQRTDRDALTALIDSASDRILLADDAGRLIGCVHIADKGAGLAYLGMFAVAPDRQGDGLGRMLIKAAEDHAIATFGTKRIEMTVIAQRRELIDWYGRRGYVLTGERRPFPVTDQRFGLPQVDTLEFVVLERVL